MSRKHLFILIALLLLSLVITISSAGSNRVEEDYDDDDEDDDEDEDGDDTDLSTSENVSKDFKFDEDNKEETMENVNRDLKRMYASWDSSDLCRDVRCNANEYCVTKAKSVAVCVKRRKDKVSNSVVKTKENLAKKKQLQAQKPVKKPFSTFYKDFGDNIGEEKYFQEIYNKEDKSKLQHCVPCAIVKPQFVCGSDNKTYSSQCRLNFHNCVHKDKVIETCKGFCPCKTKEKKKNKERKMNDLDDNLNNEKRERKLIRKEKSDFLRQKYLKAMLNGKKYDADLTFKKDKKHKSRNSVLPLPPNKSKGAHNEANKNKVMTHKCSNDDLQSIGMRLLDWFSVVIADQKRKKIHSTKKMPRLTDCQPNVSWMFNHFDTDDDLKLSLKELYYLEHDEKEKCLQPYLTSCDEDGDDYLSPYEWCTCFDRKSQPCTSALYHVQKHLLGAFIPQCDNDGFYKLLQCHTSTGMCWCVDKNGVEFTNTRRKGIPDCNGLLNSAKQRTKYEDVDAEDDNEGNDDGDDDGENGSGDGLVN